MRKLATPIVLVAYFALLGKGVFAEDPSERLESLRHEATIIKPAASELKWQKIPWETKLDVAQLAATAENRPIFLWVTGDDPLERC